MKKSILNKLQKSTLPVLIGKLTYKRRCPQVEVWCPFCKQFHIHGWPKPEEMKGQFTSRSAHCKIDTPYRMSGYLVGVEE
jgi:hypothetical protein